MTLQRSYNARSIGKVKGRLKPSVRGPCTDMAIRKSFKSEESFLEKLAIGATGTQAVMNDLRRQGFHPIELERGSSSWKIWKQIKIKRLRVPDILLLDTATRIEARAKKSLQISMSHSESDPQRGWDRGLLDDDFVALTVCTKAGNRPIDWRAGSLVQYIRVEDMREAWAAGRVIRERPKGAQEGFELRLTWPSAVTKRSGQVTAIAASRLTYQRENDHRSISLSLCQKKIALNTLVSPGEHVQEGWKWIRESLNSPYLENQLETVIILGELRTARATDLLISTLLDTSRHAEIRAGAAWAIGEIGDVRGLDALIGTFADLAPGLRAEAVRALRKLLEVQGPGLAARLTSAPSDQRAGLAWALSHSRRFTVEELVQVCQGDDEARRWVAYLLGTQDADQWATRLQPIQERIRRCSLPRPFCGRS